MVPIDCVGTDRIVRTFYCELHEEQIPGDAGPRTLWEYFVHLRDPHEVATDEIYEATFVEVNEGTVLSKALENHAKAHYRSKGIADALFADVVQRSGRRLVSSSNKSFLRDDSEFQTIPARKMWERLESIGRARFLADQDRFEFIVESVPPAS